MAEPFGVAASALAVIELSAKIISTCAEYSQAVKHATEDIARVSNEVTNWMKVLEELRVSLNNPSQRPSLNTTQKLQDTVKQSHVLLQDLNIKLTPSKRRIWLAHWGRSLKWPFKSKEIDKFLQDLVRCMQTIPLALQLDQVNALNDLDLRWVLNQLPLAEGAAFDSHAERSNRECLTDTRVGLLNEISQWINEPEAEAIFWLNGMAGTGKSTISHTLARTSLDNGQLAASFFFKKGEGDCGSASRLFTTLAYQLARREPTLGIHVKKAIDADRTIVAKTLQQQFEKLLLEPLLATRSGGQNPTILIIIIDALDECDREEDAKTIIRLFSRFDVSKALQVKVFLTSRPELPIRYGFREVTGTYQGVKLHDMEKSVIEHDLAVYFVHELAIIRKNHDEDAAEKLPSTWPDQSEIRTLVSMATPLFIFAATACLFIGRSTSYDSPNTRLQQILTYQTTEHMSQLAAMYLPILEYPLRDVRSDKGRKEALKRFKHVVGSIVLLANPLSLSALAHLLEMTGDAIHGPLKSLHSVLRIPSPSSNDPVRLLHLSFRDFLVNPENCNNNPFWIVEKDGHEQLAAHCINTMTKTLRTDMCEVTWPGTTYEFIDPQTINKKIAPEVQYACRYWVFHVQQAEMCLLDDEQVHHFLQRHYLHWLEALSLMGRASEIIPSIRTLQSLCQSQECPQLSQFVNDAWRFALANISVIQEAPLQVYSSALVFAPEKSIIRNTFRSSIPAWINLWPVVNAYWSSCLQTLHGHTDFVHSVAFSPNGKILASGSWDKTVRLWSADSGLHLRTLKGHTGRSNSIAFSPDGRVIASGSQDKTVRLWLADSDLDVRTLGGHRGCVNSVAFSPDGRMLASGSCDTTVRLWSTDSDFDVRTIIHHNGSVNSVAFSPDGKVIASGAGDCTVQLWSTDSGQHSRTLEGHSSAIECVAFSPNGSLIASGSQDKTVWLWLTDSGQHLQTLKNHDGFVLSLAFSPDNGVIASGAGDCTVRLWSAETGEHLTTLEGHSGPAFSVAFSSDGSILATASGDESVRLWSVKTSDACAKCEGHNSTVTSVVFSPDGTVLLSGSFDGTLCVWSVETGEKIRYLEGQSTCVRSVAFSPDGRVIASGSDDEIIRLWSVETGENLRTLEGHSACIVPVVALSPDESIVTSDSDDETERSYIVEAVKKIRTVESQSKCIIPVAFSPDGSIIVSGSRDRGVRLWSVETGEMIQTLEGHSSPAVSVAFSPDGSIVASGSSDRGVRLWSVETGEIISTLEGHSSPAVSVAFSPDARIVASSSKGGIVRLWSIETGACLQLLNINSWIRKLAFASDGLSLLTDHGAICLDDQAVSIPTATSSDMGHSFLSAWTGSDHVRRIGYGMDSKESWLTFNGTKLLRLPTDCMPWTSAVSGSTIAVGCESGRMIIMRFAEKGPGL